MEYKIIFRSEKIISKDLLKLQKNVLNNIFLKIDSLAEQWLINSEIKKLNHYKICNYRLRVWDYRILFDINEEKNEIIIFRILHRSKLY